MPIHPVIFVFFLSALISLIIIVFIGVVMWHEGAKMEKLRKKEEDKYGKR